MKMKKYSVYLSILMLCILMGTSCKKSLLELNPLDQLSTKDMWKNPGDAKLALTGCYNTLYESSMFQMPFWDDFSDNGYSVNNIGGSSSVTSGNLNPNTGGFQDWYYKNSYKAIGLANNFLANVGKVATGDDLKNYRGQVFFLRSFYYFFLTELYGDVPISIEDPFAVKDYTAKKAASTQAEVLALINKDLDSAIAYLPDVAYTNGNAVRGSALGLKLKVLMFQKKYADAASLANQIITSGKFDLSENYSDNFCKPQQNNSKEIMFSAKFQAPNVAHSPNSKDGISFSVSTVFWANSLGTQDLVNSYQCTDGKDTANSTVYVKGKAFENRDPRMRMTLFFPGDAKVNGWPLKDGKGNPDTVRYNGYPWYKGYYTPKKWLDPKLTELSYGTVDDQDYVFMRYAEVLLLRAEALNELGQTPAAKTLVDQVRARVKMPVLATGLSQTQMTDAIRYERRAEFALEGVRYFDLRRWGIAEKVLNGFVQNPLFPAIKLVYPAYYKTWPIPQSEVDYNKPLLDTHNAGYN